MTIKHPLTSLLPPGSSCSCPQLLEELVLPRELVLGEESRETGGSRTLLEPLPPPRLMHPG